MKKFLAVSKFRLQYAAGWVGIFGVPYLVVKQMQEQLALIQIHIPFLVLFALSVIGLVIMGYIADKLNFMGAEADESWRHQHAQQAAMQQDVFTNKMKAEYERLIKEREDKITKGQVMSFDEMMEKKNENNTM